MSAHYVIRSREGYITAPGQIFSPSGHCTPFDHRADGTIPSDGVGAVVLRRLEDAMQAGDKIYAVISGIATGSDGATDKVGITMPSSRGHAEVMKRAWEDAGKPVPARTVYAEYVFSFCLSVNSAYLYQKITRKWNSDR
jgi:acyl transferase domain-containing protein